MKFHSPYQFIAIKPALKESKTDYQNSEALKNSRYVRHDRWHKEGHSGYIHCTLTTVSPLVVGAEQTAGTESNPGCVSPYKHPDGTLAIPANSLRGMISSIVETLSNSSLRVLASQDDCTYSVRKNPKEDVFKDLGLLYKKEDNFYLYPLKDSYRVGDYTKNNDHDTRFLKHKDTETFQNISANKAAFVYAKTENNHKASQLSHEPDTGKEQGILYIRGKHFFSKKSESFIPWDGMIDESKGIKVTQQVKELANILRLIHNKNDSDQQHPKGYQRDFTDKKSQIVEEGDLLYYKKDSSDNITVLSYSQIWRRPIDGGLYHAIQRSADGDALPWNKERNQLTPAESLFGVVEEDFAEDGARNLASRLQFTDATSTENIELEDPITLKILDSPKPPSPAMYFNAGGETHLAKQDLDLNKHIANGRKHYLPHKETDEKPHWQTNTPKDQPKKSWKQHLNCCPIPTAANFSFKIHFENLSSAELGLLQTALSPSKGRTPFMHRLGLGKPLGLGQITLEIDEIKTIDRVKRYSLEGLQQTRYKNSEEIPTDTSLIDQESHGALLTLYNPDNIKHPICYPFMGEEAYAEDKGFEWFGKNEKQKEKQRQGLTPVKAGEEIPSLKSYKR